MNNTRHSFGLGLLLLFALALPGFAQMPLTATAGDRQVSLLWSNVAQATGYQVQNTTTSGGPYTVLSASQTSNTYLHTGLKNGVTNYYVITAYTPTGDVVSAQVASKPFVSVLLRAVNCGGAAAGAYLADTNYVGGTAISTTSNINMTAVTAPAPEAVYQAARSGATEYVLGTFSTSRQYRVKTHWAEIAPPTARSFSIAVVNGSAYNNWLLTINLTNASYAGAAYKAVTREGTFTPNSSGQIRIRTTGTAPLLNGVEIYISDAPLPKANVYPREGSVVLDLSIASDCATIVVSRATSSGGPYTPIFEDVAGSLYRDTNVVNGTTYYYKLTGKSAWGETDSVEYAATPGLLCYAINVNGSRIGRFNGENATYTVIGGTGGNESTAAPTIPFGTKDPAESASLYNSYRTGAQTNVFAGLLPGETYLVRMHFYEPTKTAINSRLFHVEVNSIRKMTNVDIFADVGARLLASVKECTATADVNGKLSISLVAATDVPIVSGIEIRQQSGVMTPQIPLSPAASGQPYYVALTWTTPVWSNSYTIWRSTTAGGPYSVLATNIYGDSYIDIAPADGVRFYYRVVGEVGGVTVDSTQSGEVNAVSTMGATQTGLSVQYFAGFTKDGVGERLALGGEVTPTLQTNWGTGNIGSATVGDRNAKVVWNGNVLLNRNATYSFYAKAAGGIRVWVTNMCVIDKWNTPLAGEYASNVYYSVGTTAFYPLRVEYYNTNGNAQATLEWEAPGEQITRSPIPTGCLRPVALGDPGQWVFRDVGVNANPGFCEMSGSVAGRIGIHAAGSEGLSVHQFACQQVTGPFELTARFVSYVNEGRYNATWKPRIGLAIRSSLTGTNGFAYGVMRGNSDSKVIYNNNLDVSGVYVSNAVTGAGAPVYFRMRREKTNDTDYGISAAYSANGTTWTTNFTSASGSTEKTVYAGMAMGVPESQLMYCYFDNIDLRLLTSPYTGTLLIIR